MAGFVEVARHAFAFLEHDYGFLVKECSSTSSGGYVTYVNAENGVAVKPLYEFSNAFVFVFIYRLIDGELHDNALPITDQSNISCIDFNDVLPANEKMRPAYEYGNDSDFYDEQNGLRNYVNEFASRLERFGGALLRGDFSEMDKVGEIIKRRAHELKQR